MIWKVKDISFGEKSVGKEKYLYGKIKIFLGLKNFFIQIEWSKTAQELHNFIRGMDSVPGASCKLKPPGKQDLEEVLLFGSTLWRKPKPEGETIEIEGTHNGIIHEEGLIIFGSDDRMVNVKRVKINGRMKLASTLNQISQHVEVKFTIEERKLVDSIKEVWEAILSSEVEEDTDFFAMGAGSMDVVRLVEEVKDLAKVDLENEDVFMNPTLEEFCLAVVLKGRGGQEEKEIEFKGVDIDANGLKFRVPCQLFVDGKFVDSENGYSLPSVNPNDESVICEVSNFRVLFI